MHSWKTLNESTQALSNPVVVATVAVVVWAGHTLKRQGIRAG